MTSPWHLSSPPAVLLQPRRAGVSPVHWAARPEPFTWNSWCPRRPPAPPSAHFCSEPPFRRSHVFCLGSAFSSGTRWVSGWGGSESPRRREFRRNGRLSFQGLETAGRCSWEHWPHTVTPLAAETSALSSRGPGPERPPRTTTDHRPDDSHALRTSPRSSPGTLFLRFQSLAP